MASSLDLKHAVTGLAAALLTAVLAWFGDSLFPVWPFMWFAPLPVLLFALRSRSGWGASWVAILGWGLGCLHVPAYYVSTGAPPILLLLLAGHMIVAFLIATLLFRALALRGQPWLALVAFPSCWVALEFANNLVSIHGSFGSLAYTQLDFLPFLQLASLTGPWGMSFVLLMFPAALALAWHLHRQARKQAWLVLAVTGGVLAAVLLFGTIRLFIPLPAGNTVKVGLVASDGPNEDVADAGEPTAKLFQAYAQPVAALAEQGAQVVVLPEKLGVVADPDTAALDAELQSLAEQTHVRVVAGLIRVSGEKKYNEARIYTPGLSVESYDKQHLLPPFESRLTPGSTLTTLVAAGGQGAWGVAICKDMDFRNPAQGYGKLGVGLLLVPAWDFVGDRWVHGHIAVMRGVEDGFSIVRAAKGGYLTVSDDRGRILAEAKSDSAPFATLLAEVPVHHDATLFLLWGDWFAWLAVGLLALSLAPLARRRSNVGST